MARATRLATLVVWSAALLLASFAAAAQRVEGERAGAQGVYAAEIAVYGQGEVERRAAFARGLAQVLGKLTGDADVAEQPGVSQELRRAREYVGGYDYRQDEGVSASGAPSFRTMLVVRYEQDKVDALAAMLGLPVWPQPRPKPVLWLAIDDGRGPRLVGLPQVGAARSLLDRAAERGFRLGLPNGSAAEQALVGAIWRGDTAAIARASQRYQPPMQLLGKLYRADGGWKADWIFVDHGRVLHRWSESGGDARRVMASGADGAAAALVERYAKRDVDAGPAGQYRVVFAGIDSSADFIRLSGYLQQLPVVRGITPVRASAEALEVELDLLSGLSGFDRAIEADEVLIGADPLVAGDARPDDRIPVGDGSRVGEPVPPPVGDRKPPLYRLR